MKKPRKWIKRLMWILVAVVVINIFTATGWLAYLGYSSGDGPMMGLYVSRLEKQSQTKQKGSVLFYGASNFRLWKNMETDLAPYPIINHGFGGSTDADLIKYADRLLYPFEPSVVFIQTGSNDFASGMSMEAVIENKKKMYSLFREKLPEATFVVMSSLPLPGRAGLWEPSDTLNAFLKEYCDQKDNMVFVDATDAMMPNGDFHAEYFIEDGIHLNPQGQQVWAGIILPVLSEIAP